MAVEALQRAWEAKRAELCAIERALRELGAAAPVQGDFCGLGIVEATKRFLEEQGGPRSTREIAEALKSRGIETRAKNFVATVHATLANAKGSGVERKEGSWRLTEPHLRGNSRN